MACDCICPLSIAFKKREMICNNIFWDLSFQSSTFPPNRVFYVQICEMQCTLKLIKIYPNYDFFKWICLRVVDGCFIPKRYLLISGSHFFLTEIFVSKVKLVFWGKEILKNDIFHHLFSCFSGRKNVYYFCRYFFEILKFNVVKEGLKKT